MRMRAGVTAGATALAVGGVMLPAGGAGAQEACGGPLLPPCPTPTATTTPSATPTPTATPAPGPPVAADDVELRAEPRAVAYNGRRSGRVRLLGRLVSDDAPVAGVRVRLIGRAPAYDRAVPSLSATTDAGGRFSFVVRPQLNTTYRARIEAAQPIEGRSAARGVRVFPVLHLRNRARARGLRIGVTILGPARVTFERGPERRLRPGSARRAFFYLRLRGERRYRRIGSAALSSVDCGSACRRKSSMVVSRRSLLRRTRNVGVCVRGTVFRGFGARSPCGGARKRF